MSRPARAEALILFDIDGTLIRRSGPHHRNALAAAVNQVTGLAATTDGIPVHGMLDRTILEAMLRQAGVSAARARRLMPDLVRAAQSYYLNRSPRSLRSKVCPGAVRLLAQLRRRGIPAGLVTGNLSRIGWRKMERAGLKPFLRFGAFAELAEDRAGLVRIALRHAERRGWMDPRTRVWLIGDHPNDVMAARANNVASIAVATGLSSREELAGHDPDLLVDDLRAIRMENLI
jgi:phosphoglycolate phosphatase